MKVLIINGSPRINGNTSIAIDEMARIFRAEGVETDIVQVGNKEVRGCIACGQCTGTGKCVFNDIVNELAPKFEEADGLIVASPVYYASANATLIAVLDRLFYSTHIHGKEPGQADLYEEGKQTMRVLARNMSFLMKCIALGREQIGLPKTEERVWTHFIM